MLCKPSHTHDTPPWQWIRRQFFVAFNLDLQAPWVGMIWVHAAGLGKLAMEQKMHKAFWYLQFPCRFPANHHLEGNPCAQISYYLWSTVRLGYIELEG